MCSCFSAVPFDMCWNWKVSLISSSVEWVVARHLLSRNKHLDKEYGIFIVTVATMETCQFILWLCIDNNLVLANGVVSFLLWADAWICIPLSIVNIVMPCIASSARGEQPKSSLLSDFFAAWTRRQQYFALYFTFQALAVLVAMAATGEWITVAGPHHHQIWPCAAALAAIGGHTICISTCVVYVGTTVIALQPLQPPAELRYFLGIGFVTFLPTYVHLGPTLEACSVWCWSVGAYSLYFILRGKLKYLPSAEMPPLSHATYKSVALIPPAVVVGEEY